MPVSLRVLIVDDEPIARKILQQELSLVDGVQVIGEANSGEAALAQMNTLHPDLVFLDIQMPGLSGFDVLNQLAGGNLPVIVMVTAFDQYAIRAFDAGAVDYLLKPVSPARLLQSVERAARLHRDPLAVADYIVRLQQTQPTGPQKIVGKAGGEIFLLNPDEILAFQADGELVWILTAKQRFLANQNLKSLEERLGTSTFRRVHRNALVNTGQIRKMSQLSSQRWLLTLSNGIAFVVSKRQAHYVREVLHMQ